MIKIYKNRDDSQYKKATNLLERFNLPYVVVTKTGLLYDDLQHILYLSERGFEDILVSRDQAPKVYKEVPEDFYEKTVKEMIQYILSHQRLLKNPLIFDENHLSVGYNAENIRVFVPRLRGKSMSQNNMLLEQTSEKVC
ncbi:ArsC/Spx/MgsR family protein [Lactococcus petauri]|uniref:ArsC/Spx/MgsR family protein n=1 Tax=Lactococcus petauri TaxID=1940789 RepID=UPI0038548191